MANPDSTFDPVLVNGRYLVHQVTGVQRYAREIVKQLGERVRIVEPAANSKGARGHAWEQSKLALTARQHLLWNPCGNGPLLHDLQVTTFHDLFPIEFPEWYGNAYTAWYRFAMLRLAKRAKRLIAVSEYTKGRLVALTGRDPDDVIVIPHGCVTKGRATNSEIEIAKDAMGLSGRRYVLSLASHEKRKNLETTLAAWSLIHHKFPDTWLVLSGARPPARVYGEQSLDSALPRVQFTGYVPEEHLAGLYSGAALFVFPSLAEGFGLPLVEAMGCGVRCITSSTTSLPEVGGEVVEYVDPHKPQELAEKMIRRLSARDDGPFIPVMERAARFSWKTAADRTNGVFQEIQELQRAYGSTHKNTALVSQFPLNGRLNGPSASPLRVALVHDWLTGMRGGEKVLEQLCERFPAAPLYTLLHVKGAVQGSITNRRIHTSWLQWMPRATTKYRNYLPMFPFFAETTKASGADLVISTSHCIAKGMVRRSGSFPYHICYIHTPMRYAWDRFDDYFGPDQVGTLQSRFIYRPVVKMLQLYDRWTAARVDVFVSNSRYVAERVRRIYGRPSHVLPPPVDVERFSSFDRKPEDWYLVVSALVPYKKVDHAIRACAQLNVPLKIVGKGPQLESLKELANALAADVRFLGFINDDELPEYYSRAKALLFPGVEDFGIVPVEALACGCPVVALAEGGVLDSLTDSVAQLYVEASPSALAHAIQKLTERQEQFAPEELRSHAARFSKERFLHNLDGIISRTLPHIALAPKPMAPLSTFTPVAE